jgi:tRNA (uracil-5-)-methyltransferase TRM9
MEWKISQILLELNTKFYQTHARSFSTTRQRLQPGVMRISDRIVKMDNQTRLLDLGCGNGWLASYLLQLGFQGSYLGLDASQELLIEAKKMSPYPFLQTDLASPSWVDVLPNEPFTTILAFAVLHHLPDEGLRLGLLKQIRSHLVESGGLFIHSE